MGVGVWVALFVLAPTLEWTARLLAFAPLVIVPLALAAVPPSVGASARVRAFRSAIAMLQPVGALAAAASFLFPQGGLAAALCAPWMGVTLLVFATARMEFSAAKGRRTSRDWAYAGAQLYLLLGGGWLVVTRAGGRPYDLDPVIVLLAGVHFHYATLAPPILAGRALDALSPAGGATRVAPWMVAALLGGPGLVGIGIMVSPALALFGTVVLSAGVFVLGWLLLRVAIGRVRSTWRRALLVIAAAAFLLTMPLACAYAYGQVVGETTVPLLWMIRLHGMVNAFAVALGGLLAWTGRVPVIEEASPPAPTAPPAPAPAADPPPV